MTLIITKEEFNKLQNYFSSNPSVSGIQVTIDEQRLNTISNHADMAGPQGESGSCSCGSCDECTDREAMDLRRQGEELSGYLR